MRMKDNTGASIVGAEFTWDLTTSRLQAKRKEKVKVMPAQQFASWKQEWKGL